MQLFSLGSKDTIDFWTPQGQIAVDEQARTITTGDRLASVRHDFYPDAALKEVSLAVQFTPKGNGPLWVELPPYLVNIDGHRCSGARMHLGFPPHYSSIDRTIWHDIQCAERMVIRRGEPNVLKIDYAKGRLTVKLNDADGLDFRAKYRPTIDMIQITLPSNSVVSRLDVSGQKAADYRRALRSQDYAYHMAIDFNGDIAPAPYTLDMFKSVIKRIADMGFKRIYWVYHGGLKSGFWDSMDNHWLPDDNVAATFAELGDKPLKLLVDLAHQLDMEVYAIIKPFDLSPHTRSYPFGSPLAKKFGKYDILGGRAYGCMNFVAENTHLCSKRRPFTHVEGPVTKIVLSQRDPQPTPIEDVTIWVSDDNWKYRKYEGPRSLRKKPGQFVIGSLDIGTKYFALTPLPAGAGNTFSNTPAELVRIYNAAGQEIPFTYGFTPREYPQFIKDKSEHLTTSGHVSLGFQEDGLWFDHADFGIPAAIMCGDSTLNKWFSLDNVRGVLGIALGKNEFCPGHLCPAEPEARRYWLSWVQDAISAGCDGVDIRRSFHNNILEWKQYGFNDIPVNEFKKRYGIDPRREDFDMEAWRRLRGEYYTLFLKEAKDLLKRNGKKLQVHIEDQMEGTPDTSTLQEIHWDWRAWLDEGIADEVTFKSLGIDSFRSYFGQQVVSLCRQKGIPIYYCPFTCKWGMLAREDWREYFSSQVRNSGFNGFILCELASVIRSTHNRELIDNEPELLQYLEQINKAERKSER